MIQSHDFSARYTQITDNINIPKKRGNKKAFQ